MLPDLMSTGTIFGGQLLSAAMGSLNICSCVPGRHAPHDRLHRDRHCQRCEEDLQGEAWYIQAVDAVPSSGCIDVPLGDVEHGCTRE